MGKHIWIDLANSPHVLFFVPIIDDLRRAGHRIWLTARAFAQTLPLCTRHGLDAQVLGCHGGQGTPRKIVNLCGRAMLLAAQARRRRIDLALSHNSYAQAVAARMLRLRCATLMDYEHQPANHLMFRLAHLVMVPEAFDDAALKRCGATPKRTYKYQGIKEEVYLSGYTPPSDAWRQVAELFAQHGRSFDPTTNVLLTLRPPATMATYHTFDNPLFVRLLQRIGASVRARAVVLPRTTAQHRALIPYLPANACIPAYPLDGRNLVAHSDAVVSAGGTMIREAAVLGVPAYTMFRGKMGGVDHSLIRQERVVHLRDEHDLARVRIRKKKFRRIAPAESPLRALLVAQALTLCPQPKDPT